MTEVQWKYINSLRKDFYSNQIDLSESCKNSIKNPEFKELLFSFIQGTEKMMFVLNTTTNERYNF